MKDIEENSPAPQSTLNNKITPAIDLLIPSILIIRDNLVLFAVLSVLPLLAINIGPNTNPTSLADILTPQAKIGILLSFVFYAPLLYAMVHLARGEKITLTQAFSKGYTYFVKLLALSFICGLIIVLGFVCLIVPGIIALKKLILAPYCLVAEDVTITEAMKMSASLSDKNSGAIYGLLGISLLFALAGSVLEQGGLAIGGVISAILSFLYSLAPAIRYEQMKNVYGK